jgi:hypothetical protein
MRIRIDLELPQWTKWLVSGIVIGVVLGVGAARVYADTVTVKTWVADEVLTADDLNTTIGSLKAAVDQLKHPTCPEDYAQDTTVSGIVLCKKGVDEVVKVGTSNTVFWIDRYEASIWVIPNPVVGTTIQYGVGDNDYPSTFPINGEYGTTPLYALSVPNVGPAQYVTWFQAEAACEASGKRLPTGQEWLRAARGTPDPGSANTAGPGCNCMSQSLSRWTGLGTACASAWGAQDMIGNLAEWTAEWYAGPGATGSVTFAGTAFRDDEIMRIASGAFDNATYVTGLPAVAFRGAGSDMNPTQAGRFAMSVSNAPSTASPGVGFRCVLTH